MPGVSVVIPTYNSAAYLAATLTSIQQQTLPGFEVVMVDDGSTDDTVREAARFAGTLDLRIIRQPNAGPAAARNSGIRNARGHYCAFIDADDVMLPTRLAEQAAALDANPQLGLIHTDLMTFDDSGTLHTTRRAFSDPCGGWILDRLLLDNSITTSTVMARTQRLVEAGMFNEGRRISEDFELWLKMAERWPCGYIEHPLVRYRRRPGSLSNDKWVTGLAALEVVEEFWRTHAGYGAQHSTLRHRSLGRHLSSVGAAAIQQGKPFTAIPYLLRALRHQTGHPPTWKLLVKAAIGWNCAPRTTGGARGAT